LRKTHQKKQVEKPLNRIAKNRSRLAQNRQDFGRLRKLMDRYGVERIVTVSDPKSTPDEDESLLAKWGNTRTNRFGGRPMKQRTKKSRLKNRSIELRKTGLGWRRIAKTLAAETGIIVSYNSVRNWVLETV